MYMKTRILAFIAGILLATGAHAATISQFGRTTNDGVWALSAAQATALGVSGATKMGAFRVRAHGAGNVTWAAGDTFDASAVAATITSGAGNVFGYFNGFGDGLLDYTGDFLAPLGLTTFLADSATDGDLFRGVFFAFNDQVVFRNSSTFNAVTQGDFPFEVTPVPVPAALPLLLAGLGGLAFFGRRRKAA
jgi:hypothetical protein